MTLDRIPRTASRPSGTARRRGGRSLARAAAALAAALALSCGAVRADPVQPRDLAPPELLAAGQGDWLWVVWLGEGGKGDRGGRPTRVVAKQTNKAWLEVHDKYLPRVRGLAARGDRLDVLLPDGMHYRYRADGGGEPMDPLPRGWRPLALAGGGNKLYALVVASGRAEAPDAPPHPSGPTGASTALERDQATTGPADRSDGAGPAGDASAGGDPASAARIRLLVQEEGPWRMDLPAPPDDLERAERVSLTVHLLRPTVLAWIDGELFELVLLPDSAGEPARWRRTRVALGPGVGPLIELIAVSLNQQLYLIGWSMGAGPTATTAPAAVLSAPDRDPRLLIGRVNDGELIDVEELAESPGPLEGRHKSWDLAAAGRAVVFVRTDPNGPGLQARRFDPQTRRFTDDWQPVAGINQPVDWLTRLVGDRLFMVVIIAAIVLLMLTRRPSGVIRLPTAVEPARVRDRALAFLIDWLPCSMGAYLVVFGVDPSAAERAIEAAMSKGASDPQVLRLSALSIAVFVAYQAIAEGLTATTLGKRLFRLTVLSVSGTRPTVVQVAIRSLLKGVEIPLLPFIALLALIHPARQRIGDILAGTIVVGPRRSPLPPHMVQPADEHPPDPDDAPRSDPDEHDDRGGRA